MINLDPKKIRDAATTAALTEVQLGLGHTDLRLGEVVSINQAAGIFTARLNGDPDPDHLVPDVRPLFSYGPQVGDLTWILKNRSDYIAIGPVGWGTSPSPPRCLAFVNTAIPLTDGAWELMTLDGESYDLPYGTMHSTLVIQNNSRVIAPEDGNYTVTCGIRTTDLAATLCQFQVRKNSAGSDTGGTRILLNSQNGAGGGQVTQLGRSKDLDMLEDDYVELFLLVNTGANPDASAGTGDTGTFLQLRKNFAI
jgi:hypothetical protein